MARTIHFCTLCFLFLPLSWGALACNVELIDDIDDTGQAIPEDVQMAFDRSCATVGCHAASGQAGLSLNSGGSAAIIGGRSSQVSDFKLVVIGDVEKSYLALKMLAPDDLPPGTMIQGGPMPPNKSADAEVDIATILAWIESGAMDESGF